MLRHRALVFCIALAVVACSSDEVDTNGSGGDAASNGGSAGLGGSGTAGSGGATGGAAGNIACGYPSPGCGDAAPETICEPGAGGLACVWHCACDLETICNAGVGKKTVRKPWIHVGWCNDASADGGADSGVDSGG